MASDDVPRRWRLPDHDQVAVVAVLVPEDAPIVDTRPGHDPHRLTGLHPDDVRDTDSSQRRDLHLRTAAQLPGPDAYEGKRDQEEAEEDECNDPRPNAPPPPLGGHRLGDEPPPPRPIRGAAARGPL